MAFAIEVKASIGDLLAADIGSASALLGLVSNTRCWCSCYTCSRYAPPHYERPLLLQLHCKCSHKQCTASSTELNISTSTPP